MAKKQGKVGEDKDGIIAAMPLACSDELAAVELMERLRWEGSPVCPHCSSAMVYAMTDRATGARSSRYLWRCKAEKCGKQFTVRVGTVMQESRIPLRHWCYAWWAACASKKGVSALQIKRQTGLSYRSALFLMHRVRYAMAGEEPTDHLGGEGKIVESDETWVGGKPRVKGYKHGRRKVWSTKKPVIAMIERDGKARVRVMERVTAKTLADQLKRHVHPSSVLSTDELHGYKKPGKGYAKHLRVCHSRGQYAMFNGAHCNTAESLFALVKRGLYGTFHSVSKHNLHRYMSEFEFRWNHRKATDGERTAAAFRQGIGKRLTYAEPVSSHNAN
jgi:transposase-like protein